MKDNESNQRNTLHANGCLSNQDYDACVEKDSLPVIYRTPDSIYRMDQLPSNAVVVRDGPHATHVELRETFDATNEEKGK